MRQRGISDLVAALILLGVVVFGGYVVYSYFQSNSSAVTKANVAVYASAVGDYIQVNVKNMGSTAVEIVNVTVDGTSIIGDLGWTGETLAPGEVLQGIAPDPGLDPGSHVIEVTYRVDDQTHTAASEFVK